MYLINACKLKLRVISKVYSRLVYTNHQIYGECGVSSAVLK